MKPLFRQLPPLHTLTFFEAAARHGSFTRAADELCVTQSAVSKQIRMLEDNLGTALFHRERRQVMLTDAGQVLYSEVQESLNRLAESSSRIRSRVSSRNLTIVATVAVAHYWLFPRIARFNMEHPEININVFATDEINEELCRKSDLGILYGNGVWSSSLESHYLFRERIYPICGADMEFPSINQAEDLLQLRIINLDPQKWRWITWQDWFEHFGVDYRAPADALAFNQVPLAINAAMKGMGVTLAWEFMIGELLEHGLLQLVGQQYVETGKADYLVCDASKPLCAAARLFRDWLLASETDIAQRLGIGN